MITTEFQASNIKGTVQSDHLLCWQWQSSGLFLLSKITCPPCYAGIQPMSQKASPNG